MTLAKSVGTDRRVLEEVTHQLEQARQLAEQKQTQLEAMQGTTSLSLTHLIKYSSYKSSWPHSQFQLACSNTSYHIIQSTSVTQHCTASGLDNNQKLLLGTSCFYNYCDLYNTLSTVDVHLRVCVYVCLYVFRQPSA